MPCNGAGRYWTLVSPMLGVKGAVLSITDGFQKVTLLFGL